MGHYPMNSQDLQFQRHFAAYRELNLAVMATATVESDLISKALFYLPKPDCQGDASVTMASSGEVGYQGLVPSNKSLARLNRYTSQALNSSKPETATNVLSVTDLLLSLLPSPFRLRTVRRGRQPLQLHTGW